MGGNGQDPLGENPPRTADSETVSFERSLASIDRELANLLIRRCQILRAWRQSRLDADFPSLRAAMRSALGTVESSLENGIPSDGGEFPWREVIGQSLAYISGATFAHAVQREPIAYLGPQQSYSYLAAVKFFGAAAELQGVASIAAVFEEIERRQARYGVVPIENSTDGRIVDTLTMFIRTPLQICGEILLPIHHNLLARCERSAIRTIYSKPQALSQCRAWLGQHVPGARWVEVASTTAAAQIAAEEPNAAAVASLEAALEHGLDVVAKSIEDNPNNTTRFVVIGLETPEPTGNDKTSLLFQVPHKPGALADVMVLFKNSGLNLTWIESFPIPGTANEYFFFVELEGHRRGPSVDQAIRKLSEDALRLEWLGSYPKAAQAVPRKSGVADPRCT